MAGTRIPVTRPLGPDDALLAAMMRHLPDADAVVLAAAGSSDPAWRADIEADPMPELVSLDDAPHVRVVGNLDGADVTIGMAVVATWDERTAEDGTAILLPQWVPA